MRHQPTCNQCGFTHPPLPQGEICPMAKQKDSSGRDIDLSKFFGELKKLISDHIRENNLNREDQEKMCNKLLEVNMNFLFKVK